jgi:iron complex transport system substrate-binding protein
VTGGLVRLLFVLCAAALAPAGAGAADPPRRVVSTNLCLDQIALLIAAPGQLAAVSFLAHDPGLSPLWREARSLPAVELRAEAIVALKPDLVLTDSSTGAMARRALARFGVAMLDLRPADTLADAAPQVARIAAVLGRDAQGAALVARMQAETAALTARVDGRRPLAAIWQANGYTLGSGSPSGDVLRLAGFRNLADARGLAAYARLSVEALLADSPDLLVFDGEVTSAPSLADQAMTHRAVVRAFDGARLVRVPHRLWTCAGPASVEALRLLIEAREALGARAG